MSYIGIKINIIIGGFITSLLTGIGIFIGIFKKISLEITVNC